MMQPPLLLPVFLLPGSWIILTTTTTTTSPTVRVYQQGVQGNIKPWLAASPPHNPLQRFFLLLLLLLLFFP